MKKRLPDAVRAYMSELGTRGGHIAAARMSPAQRRARALKASRAAAVARTKKKANQGD